MESSPVVGEDGTIYFGGWDSYIYALRPDGNPIWKYQLGSDIRSSPTIDSNGVICVGSSDGCIYAIHSNSRGLANSCWPKFRSNIRNTGKLGDR